MRSERPRSLSLSQALCLAARRSRGVGRGSAAEMRARPAEILETGRVMMGVIKMVTTCGVGGTMVKRWDVDGSIWAAQPRVYYSKDRWRTVQCRGLLERCSRRRDTDSTITSETTILLFFFINLDGGTPRNARELEQIFASAEHVSASNSSARVGKLGLGIGGIRDRRLLWPQSYFRPAESFFSGACLWAGQPVGKPVGKPVLSTSWAGLCLLTRA